MRARLLAIAVAVTPTLASAQTTTVNYTLSVAGLPVGSATMTLAQNGGATALSISGSAGGPLQIGRMSASATIGQGMVTAQSSSGSGKNATRANVTSQGSGGSSRFSYDGTNERGAGKLAMTIAGGRVAALEASIPDNPQAVRVPVTDAHKTGVIDPLVALAQVIGPGRSFRPEALCGRSLQVFTGVQRISLSGSAVEDAKPPRGMPDGYRAQSCRVTFTPMAGHRVDKGGKAQPRTATVVFATRGDQTILWSVAVPVMIGSFAMTAREIR